MASTMPPALYDDISYSPIRNMRSLDDDDASLWSVQVNVSSPINACEQPDADSLLRDQEQKEGEDEAEEEEDEAEEEEEEAEEEEEEEDCGEEKYSELCQGLSGLSVGEKGVNDNKPQGKHTRFVYNSDDELEAREETEAGKTQLVSPSVTRLNGFPTPAGKHLRFSEGESQEEEEEEEKGEKQEQENNANCKTSEH